MRRINHIILLLLCLLFTLNAHATVTVAASTGTTKNVLLGRSTAITVGWSVRDSTSVAGSTTVSSAQGRYCLAVGCVVVLGTNSRTLSQTYVSPGGFLAPYPKNLSFTESVVVPFSVIHRAHKNGVSTFVYERKFTSTEGAGASVAVNTSLRISSATSFGFFVTRVALKFEDGGAPLKVVGQGDALGIRAELSFNGTGLIRGVWEVANPTITTETPVFRPLRSVRQYLITGDSKTLVSPTLPTRLIGQYRVRLRLTEPELNFVLPEIRYFVSARRPESVPPPAPISLIRPPLSLIRPPPSASLTPKLLFRWQAVKAARVYQLEFHTDTSSPLAGNLPDLSGGGDLASPRVPVGQRPVTGMMVPRKRRQTILSAAARQHLQSRQRYLWRVLAIGKDGTVIGTSEARRIQVP